MRASSESGGVSGSRVTNPAMPHIGLKSGERYLTEFSHKMLWITGNLHTGLTHEGFEWLSPARWPATQLVRIPAI